MAHTQNVEGMNISSSSPTASSPTLTYEALSPTVVGSKEDLGFSHITAAYNDSFAFSVEKNMPLRDNDIVIATMGPTGSGKSTFVAHMTKYYVKVGDTLAPCTTRLGIIRLPSHFPGLYGDLVFVDTPGIDDTRVKDEDVLKMLHEWLKPSGVKLSALLYFHRISDNRMTEFPLPKLRMFDKLCGKNMFDSVMLVTTMWDEVKKEAGEERERQLVDKYWRLMMVLGSQIKRFIRDQDGPSRFAILESLISVAAKRSQKGHQPSIETVILQKEAQNGSDRPDTAAGQQIFDKVQGIAGRRKNLIQGIKEVSKAGCNPETMRSLMDDLEDTQREILIISVETRRMKAPISQWLKRLLGRLGIA